MALLTKRSLGITDGFTSGYKRDDLIQKLGHIEHESEDLFGELCDTYCKFREELDQCDLADRCEMCPLSRLGDMIN